MAVLAHVVGSWVINDMLPSWPVPRGAPVPVSLVILPPEEKPEEPEVEEEDELDGQIVDVAPPEVEERPEEADYLAEHDITVEEETKTDKVKVNPEVLAPEFSTEQKMEQEDLMDLDVEKPSTGAQVGNDRFDPDRDGTMASLPSPWKITNEDGIEDPVPSSHMDATMAGAPNNDLLEEKRGDSVNLNTKEFLYAAYLNRIRRLVNFYWEQHLDNLPRSVRLAKPRYTTGVHAVLDSNGGLERVDVTTESSSGELDDCVVRAFQVAGPFPNPPEGLIEKDGRVYLPEMRFTVVLGVAENQYRGIDPRAGVQFPGLLKSPR